MTYSIVARDESTGQLGVAVQTGYFAVGSAVPWARPGVGAVATQAISEPAYGPRCLAALEALKSASDALAEAQAADPMSALRQVGVVSADGSAAALTGELCIDHAGHHVGDGFTVQANMMSSPAVWDAMAATYEEATGPFARRLFAALLAGEAAGGDARGMMSAALVVVDGQLAEVPGGGLVTDVRVDRSDDPLAELGRLLDAADAFRGFDLAVEQLTGGDPEAARVTAESALELLPGELNLRFIHCGALMASGDVEGGGSELRALVAEHPGFEVLVRSFAAKGLIAVPEGQALDDVLG